MSKWMSREHAAYYYITHFFPSAYLLFTPDPWHVREASGAGGNEGGFSDEQSPRYAGSLGVILFYDLRFRDVVVVCSEPRQGCHHDPMSQLHVADADRLEKRGCGRHEVDWYVGDGDASVNYWERICVV